MGPKTERGIRLYLAVTAVFLLSTVALAMALVFTLSKLATVFQKVFCSPIPTISHLYQGAVISDFPLVIAFSQGSNIY